MFLNIYIYVRVYLPELGARRQDKQQFVVERSRLVAVRKRNSQQSAHDSVDYINVLCNENSENVSREAVSLLL